MIKIKEGFKNERVLSVSDKLLEEYAKDSLISQLYIRKIGYFPQAKFHFIQKAEGCDYAMLIYCTDGEGWCRIHRKTYQLPKNTFMMLPPHTPYTFGSSDQHPWTIYWIHFLGHQMQKFLPSQFIPRPILPDDNSRIQERLNLFEEIYYNFSMNYLKEYMTYSSICLYKFLASFTYLQQYRGISSATESSAFSARAIHYMQENVQDNLTLESLSAHFKYSPSHFSALFQKETGISPIHYFIRLKIQKACQLLELTDLKITEISQNLGFKDPAYFSRIFTKFAGTSPSDYRTKGEKWSQPLPKS